MDALGFAGSPIVEWPTFERAGLRLASGGSTVRGLVIRLFSTGLQLEGTGNHVVEGCYLGTDVTGTVASPNGAGISIVGGSLNNRIGRVDACRAQCHLRNSSGIAGVNNASTTMIQGNLIGTNAAGTAPLPEHPGHRATGAPAVIGGSAAGEGNLISG